MRECKRARRQPAGQFDAGLRPLLPSIPNPMSGWYVRWDVAYGWYQMDSAAASPGSANPVLNDLSKGLSGGGGRVTKATGCAPTSPSTIPASTIAERSLRPGDTTAKLEAITGLFNAYLDLGTWYCFTPYVGADRNFRVHQQAGAALHAATVQYAMAIRLGPHGGTAINLSPSFAVDVGYRYLDLGDASTATDAFGQITLKNIAAHEARVSVGVSSDVAIH